jgi:hypothetical protein
MSKQAIKTNNDADAFLSKVQLRLNSLPKKDTVKVLECYAGEGKLWKSVKSKSDKNISITPIDIKSYEGKLNLKGDNIKYLKTIDLSKYDIVDLDAYGFPFAQIKTLFDREYKGIVHVTAIQMQ